MNRTRVPPVAQPDAARPFGEAGALAQTLEKLVFNLRLVGLLADALHVDAEEDIAHCRIASKKALRGL